MNFEDLRKKVLDWADGKDLLHEENAEKQFMKFMEEVFEFKSEMDGVKGINKDPDVSLEYKDFARRNLMLEMGDVFVTLIILCRQLGIEPTKCLELAYEKIRARKGKTIDGCFVKEEDLK